MVTSQIELRKYSIDQHTFQCITSTKCTAWKSSVRKLQNLLRTTDPENFSLIGPILLKISFLTEAKTTCFEKTRFELTLAEIAGSSFQHFMGVGCGVWGVGCGVWGVGARLGREGKGKSTISANLSQDFCP